MISRSEAGISILFIYSLINPTSAWSTQKQAREDLSGLFNDDNILSTFDLIKDRISPFLSPLDLGNFSISCRDFTELSHMQMRVNAQKEIKNLIGELIELIPGKFVMGTGSREQPTLTYFDQKRQFVEIDKTYLMPEFDVSQKQVERVMGKEWVDQAYEQHLKLRGDQKPMTGLTLAKWDEYLEKLNKKLKLLWPVAYPNQTKIPQAQIPKTEELSYAMTDPVDPKDSMKTEKDGEYNVTAKHMRYSGTNSDQNNEIEKYVVFNKTAEDGLADVNHGTANLRGFYNLTGNVWKQSQTKAPTLVINNVNHLTDADVSRAVVGGSWVSPVMNCRSATQFYLSPQEANIQVGLRLVLK